MMLRAADVVPPIVNWTKGKGGLPPLVSLDAVVAVAEVERAREICADPVALHHQVTVDHLNPITKALPEITLPAPAAVPPIVRLLSLLSRGGAKTMPFEKLPSAALPVASTPMKLP